MSTPLFIDDRLNRPTIAAMMDRPGVKQIEEMKFISTLDYVTDGPNLYYHPDMFIVRFDYRSLWLRAGVEIGPGGGWNWKTEICKDYWSLGIETVEALAALLATTVSGLSPAGRNNYTRPNKNGGE